MNNFVERVERDSSSKCSQIVPCPANESTNGLQSTDLASSNLPGSTCFNAPGRLYQSQPLWCLVDMSSCAESTFQ